MATATYDTIIREVEQLTPKEQARLMEYLEDLADSRIAEESRTEEGEDLSFEEAVAEIERERRDLGID